MFDTVEIVWRVVLSFIEFSWLDLKLAIYVSGWHDIESKKVLSRAFPHVIISKTCFESVVIWTDKSCWNTFNKSAAIVMVMEIAFVILWTNKNIFSLQILRPFLTFCYHIWRGYMHSFHHRGKLDDRAETAILIWCGGAISVETQLSSVCLRWHENVAFIPELLWFPIGFVSHGNVLLPMLLSKLVRFFLLIPTSFKVNF